MNSILQNYNHDPIMLILCTQNNIEKLLLMGPGANCECFSEWFYVIFKMQN